MNRNRYAFRALADTSQPLRVPLHMALHKGRDKVIGVIIPLLHLDVCGDAGFLAGDGEQAGFELFVQKIVFSALIDQQMVCPCAVLDQCDSIIFAPCAAVRPKITAQRFFAV